MNQIPKEEIERYFSLFVELSSSNQNDEIQKAEAILNEEARVDIIKAILIAAIIVTSNDVPPNVAFLAICFIKNQFIPIPPLITEATISQKWLAIDPVYRNQVKAAIFRGFMFDEFKIVAMAALAFATLLKIEKQEMYNLIPELFKLIEGQQYTDLTQSGALNVLSQIVSKDFLGGHTEAPEVQQVLTDIFARLGIYFQGMGNKSISYQSQVASTISSLLDLSTPLFADKAVIKTLINNILEYVKPIYTIPINPADSMTPSQLHDIYLQVFYKIIKYHYQNKDFSIAPIENYTIRYITQFNTLQLPSWVICNLLQFWTTLAEYEVDLLKNNLKLNEYNNNIQKLHNKNAGDSKNLPEQRISVYRGFCRNAIQAITEPCIQLMLRINPRETDSEDLSLEREPHMYAWCCLIKFFYLEPAFILDKVRTYWRNCLTEQIHIKNSKQPLPSNQWVQDHTMLLTFSIILENTDTDITNEIDNFLYTSFLPNGDFIIIRDFILNQCLIQCQIPRVVDTCLFTLSKFIEKYPSLFTPPPFDFLMHYIFSNIANIQDSIIIHRIIQVLVSLFNPKNWPRLNSRIVEESFTNFNLFIQLFNNLIERPDAFSTTIYLLSYSMIQNLILFAASQEKCQSLITTFLINQMTYLEQLFANPKDNMNARVTSVLSLLSNLFRLNMRKIIVFEPLFGRIMNIFEQLLNPQSPVFEDALKYCSIICQRWHSNSSDILEKINKFIGIALQSGNPSIITDAAHMRACLYETYIKNNLPQKRAFLDKFDEDYQMVVQGCLNDTRFTKDFYPTLLKSVARMIAACADYKKDYFPQVLDLYQYYSQMPLILQKESDFEYANAYFEAMFSLLSSLMLLYDKSQTPTKPQLLKFMKLLMDNIPKKYALHMVGHFSKGSMDAALKFLKRWNDTFFRDGNIILHRRYNYEIVFWAMTIEGLKEEAQNTLQMINEA